MIGKDPSQSIPWLGWTWCRCCGVRVLENPNIHSDSHRCKKHIDRNPCAIEGCARTTTLPASGAKLNDVFLCAEHWRLLVPARSAERRLFHRFHRRAKLYGWTAKRRRAYYRFWDALVSRARRRAGTGFVDVAEINRLMGWDDDGTL